MSVHLHRVPHCISSSLLLWAMVVRKAWQQPGHSSMAAAA